MKIAFTVLSRILNSHENLPLKCKAVVILCGSHIPPHLNKQVIDYFGNNLKEVNNYYLLFLYVILFSILSFTRSILRLVQIRMTRFPIIENFPLLIFVPCFVPTNIPPSMARQGKDSLKIIMQ